MSSESTSRKRSRSPGNESDEYVPNDLEQDKNTNKPRKKQRNADQHNWTVAETELLKQYYIMYGKLYTTISKKFDGMYSWLLLI